MSELPFNPPPPDEPSSPPTPRPAVKARPVRRPIVATPTGSKRDTFIALLCGGAVLALVIAGMLALSAQKGKPSGNQLTGTIVAKHHSGEVEKEISVGRKGLKSKQIDSGFSFDVLVEAENRTYEVPVDEGRYISRKVGDKQTFIRPRNEQK
jgi:hypothetical protein